MRSFTAIAVVLFLASLGVQAMNKSKYQAYLEDYGYMHKSDDGTDSLLDKGTMEDAVRKFQKFVGIPVTGQLDDATVSAMEKPRCGIMDFLITKKDSKFADYNIFTRWSKKQLTWRLNKPTERLTVKEQENAIKYSLDVWANVSGITFKQISTESDIEIGFYTGKHLVDEKDFDGQGNVLAHAYYPGTYKKAGDTHMDDDENWAVKTLPHGIRKISLAVVLVHEFGHALGLMHEPSVSDSIMQPMYAGWSETVTLGADDIAGIQKLYGRNPANPQEPQETQEPVVPEVTQVTKKSTTSAPTTTTKTSIADICKDLHIDAAFEINSGYILVFTGSNVVLMSYHAAPIVYPINYFILKSTLRTDRKIDAAMKTSYVSRRKFRGRWRTRVLSRTGIFIFQGNKVHEFGVVNGRLTQISEELISVVFEGVPDDIDAAFSWTGNYLPYVIKGDKFYLLNKNKKNSNFKVDRRYPRKMRFWRGVPTGVDSVFSINDFGVNVFIKGERYYTFNNTKRRANRRGRSISQDLFNCRSANSLLGIDQQLGMWSRMAMITDGAQEVVTQTQNTLDENYTPPTTLRDPAIQADYEQAWRYASAGNSLLTSSYLLSASASCSILISLLRLS